MKKFYKKILQYLLLAPLFFPTIAFAGHHPGLPTTQMPESEQAMIDPSTLAAPSQGTVIGIILVVVVIAIIVWWFATRKKK